MIAIIGNIFKKHILNAPARSLAILLIVKYTQIHQLSLPEILDADILEPYIPDQIIITCIDSQTALIIHLHFPMIQNINVPVSQILHHFIPIHISV